MDHHRDTWQHKGTTTVGCAPHAVQLFVSNSKYSESAIRVGLSDSTTSNKHSRATPTELAWLKQQGAVTSRSTLITLVSLSKCLEVGSHFGVPSTILDQLRQQPQAVTLAHMWSHTIVNNAHNKQAWVPPAPQLWYTLG